ncbi:MAG TPA: glucose 1-dehydrogenase [Geminicoccaceae bacterium]|nr:glucose 1-dehydrogenase [Geminicoccaceae bacterium]
MSATTFDLGGRVALVTGASGGLGLHFARTLAEAGARVALAARRKEQLEANAATIGADSAIAVAMDVSEPESVDRGVAEVAERFGGPATVVVNNSGVTASQTALDLDPADWDKVMDTNVKGAWLVARAAARRMIDAGVGGSVVNIASILGFRVAGRVAPYAASKAGLLHLTRALALEWARYGIRVNAIAPGYVETDLNRDFFASDPGKALIARIPQRRLGRIEDLDGALLLLASDASAYMTGSAIVVDGGHLQSTL